MTSVIGLPTNVNNYPFANIYRASSPPLANPYNLIETINARQLEYEDPDGDYSKVYAVSFSTAPPALNQNVHETTMIAVKSVAQKILDIIRIELNLSETEIPASSVDYFISQAKIDVQMDICKFVYGEILTSITDTIYQLPNKYFYDLNCAGVVSILDFQLWKQEAPITIYSPKIPVITVDVNAALDARYIELAESTNPQDVLKLNYYSTDRPISTVALHRLIAYRICTMHYENISIANSVMPYSSIRIGDISISQRSGSSTNSVTIDSASKMASKYTKLLTNFRSGFLRVN